MLQDAGKLLNNAKRRWSLPLLLMLSIILYAHYITCNTHITRHHTGHEINRKGVAITNGGNLSAKKVIHLDVQGINGKAEWKKGITTCLKEAEKARLASLSFPALGTG